MSDALRRNGPNRGKSAVKSFASPVRILPLRFVSYIIVCCTVLTSCTNSSSDSHQYNDVRIVSESSHPILPGASSVQRFGSDRPTRPANERINGPVLAYDLPAGWVEVPLTRMRRLNVLIGGDASTECYLSILPGGGSLRANIDRWCKQMQQEPISEEALLTLPRIMLLGAEAVRFEIDGTFSGGVSGKPVADARMIVHVLPIGDTTVFLKATGPRALIESESDTFTAFAASIRLDGPQSQSQTPPSYLRWQVPTDWQVDSPRPMREVTFVAGQDTRCWITLLGGDGGGALANTNRWLAELGQDPISPAQLAQLPTMKILDGDAIVIESTGSYSSMGSPPQDGWALIGLIRILPDRTVFIKLVGPAEEVEAARDSMSELVSSLEVTT